MICLKTHTHRLLNVTFASSLDDFCTYAWLLVQGWNEEQCITLPKNHHLWKVFEQSSILTDQHALVLVVCFTLCECGHWKPNSSLTIERRERRTIAVVYGCQFTFGLLVSLWDSATELFAWFILELFILCRNPSLTEPEIGHVLVSALAVAVLSVNNMKNTWFLGQGLIDMSYRPGPCVDCYWNVIREHWLLFSGH